MITILWEDNGIRNWKQFSGDETALADEFMERLRCKDSIIYEDIIVFFEDSFSASCYGETYNIPIGEKVHCISEDIDGVIRSRKITDSGVVYEIEEPSGDFLIIRDRNIEVKRNTAG